MRMRIRCAVLVNHVMYGIRRHACCARSRTSCTPALVYLACFPLRAIESERILIEQHRRHGHSFLSRSRSKYRIGSNRFDRRLCAHSSAKLRSKIRSIEIRVGWNTRLLLAAPADDKSISRNHLALGRKLAISLFLFPLPLLLISRDH